MKMRVRARWRRGDGILLMECIFYMAILAVFMGMTGAVFFKFSQQSSAISRNSEQIARSLRAGEKWRADVRFASALETFQQDNLPFLRILQETNEVLYTFQHGAVWRREPGREKWQLLLEDVKNSSMTNVKTAFSEAWVWELELSSKEKRKLTPRFSFIAAPGRQMEEK